MQPSAPKPPGLSVMGEDLWSFTPTWGSPYHAAAPAEAAGLGGGTGADKTAFTTPRSRLDPPGSHDRPLVPTPRTRRKSGVPQKKTVGFVHNDSRMGRCRRTTGPLLPRRDPKSAFPGKKAELRTAFQCVFSQKNKYKGIFFFSLQGTAL